MEEADLTSSTQAEFQLELLKREVSKLRSQIVETESGAFSNYETNVKCDHCGHEWTAISPIKGEDCTQLECPECGKSYWVANVDSRPVHLIISDLNGAIWLRPSRAVPISKLKEMVHTAIEMFQDAPRHSVFDPEECGLQAELIIDETQVLSGDYEK